YAVSRHVFPAPVDWPSHHHMTGYFFLDEEEWEPDKELAEFISGGDPPVVFTFGSTTYQSPETLTEIILDAVKRVGCRAIIQHGWSGLATRRLPPDVMAVGYVPHNWLFQRARCVVHHGGAGTVAASYRAGVPSIFITHGPSFRAELARELGCVGAVVSYWELSAESLASALAATLSNPACREAARLLADKIRTERGVENACLQIEKLVGVVDCEDGVRLAQDRRVLIEDRQERIARRRSYQRQRRLRKPSKQTC
ncbi:MAG: glycosyltransferase, partial [Blastocatellia bacterium]|nr:glycosyltransferase [Blastocatellia bacterium]